MQAYPLCKEKNMNVKSILYTDKVLWTVWELDVEDYEILLVSSSNTLRYYHFIWFFASFRFLIYFKLLFWGLCLSVDIFYHFFFTVFYIKLAAAMKMLVLKSLINPMVVIWLVLFSWITIISDKNIITMAAIPGLGGGLTPQDTNVTGKEIEIRRQTLFWEILLLLFENW